jgi:hypothetical protein
MFHDVLSVTMHGIIAKKILKEPALIEQARGTLEVWISKRTPVPSPLMEWRDILTRTPQEIAAVAMSLTEEATRLRSSSPLGCTLTPKERTKVYALFGKKLRLLADLREDLGAAVRGEKRASTKPKTMATNPQRRQRGKR